MLLLFPFMAWEQKWLKMLLGLNYLCIFKSKNTSAESENSYSNSSQSGCSNQISQKSESLLTLICLRSPTGVSLGIDSTKFLQSKKLKQARKMWKWWLRSSFLTWEDPSETGCTIQGDFSLELKNSLLSFGRRLPCLWKGGMLSNGARSKVPSLLESFAVRVWIRKVLLQTSCTPHLKFPGNSFLNM